MSSSEDFSDTEPTQKKPARATSGSKKKVEDIYKKTNLREHILNRPDSYIGTLESETDKLFIINESGEKFEQRSVTYVPGLFKIFDEILVNAADNKQRDPRGMTELRIDVDKARNTISVYNNGQGIPIQIHKEYNIYVPELIFGQLLTSSNYDDSEKRTVGGRNGFGAKLTNIFSKSFLVETCDGRLTYRQLFKNNMFDKGEPEIEKTSGKDSYTRVTFSPDLQRFNMSELEDDMIALIKKRTYDIAGTSGKGLKVYYNKKLIGIKDFKTFCEMHLQQPGDLIYEVINDRWEVGIAPTDGSPTQVSFVNRISTFRGGTHVTTFLDQCVKSLTDLVSKKNKKVVLRPQHFKNHIWVFVNSLVENPKFDTQTKVNLTSTKSSFGSNTELSESFMKKLSKSPIVSSILSFAQFQQDKELKKTDAKKKTSRLIGIPKLEDANMAGTRNSNKCTLIITEGDSAKALAMSGLSVVGRDYYGVFPIRGKLLNVRDATTSQILDNAEITYLKQIIGLQQGKVYNDRSTLRYGHIMIMTDQDHDGSHIKGLIINMFAHFWPSLLRTDGFLTEFITPIVKVSKSKNVGSARDALTFYTIPEFEEWRENTNNGKGFNTKYYKGLGTSTSAEAKVYFSNIDSHQIPFFFKDEKCIKLIEMLFSKSTADERKNWLTTYVPGTFLSHAVNKISYQDFINKELILFSIASNQRAIPSLIDGLKPGQRKVLFACFKRKLTKELKVAQLAGYVAEQSAYHHGEVSLAQTIVALAQNYVGANNINYLWPAGQFGTRAGGGKDAASSRYIFTYLSPVTRVLFNIQDDPLLNYLNDDGQAIEPDFYVPIIPTVLLNGSAGIGTGWSTEIHNHNPRDLIDNIRLMLDDQEPEEMHPWYKGFIGQIAQRQGRRGVYFVRGLYDVVDEKPNTVHVYELPVGDWTSGYKTWLESLTAAGDVLEMSEYHTDVTVSFLITFSDACWTKANNVVGGLRSYLKLETTMSLSNMVLFNSQGKLQRYDSTTDILKEFYPIRHALYQKRKDYIMDLLNSELTKIDSKVRFIQYVIEEKIKLRNIKRADLLKALEDFKFQPISAVTKLSTPESLRNDGRPHSDAESGSENDGDSDDERTTSSSKKGAKKNTPADSITDRLKGYTYLTSMPLLSLTYEKVQELLKDKKSKEDELAEIKRKSVKDLWTADLEQLDIALDEHEAKELQELRAGENAKYAAGRSPRSIGGGRGKASNYDDSDSDDASDEGDWGKSKKKKAPAKKATAAGKKSGTIPDFVLRLLASRPKEQTFHIEEETELDKKKRLKTEATAAAKLSDVAALLGLDSSMMDLGDGVATSKKPRAKRVTKTASMGDGSDDETAAKKTTARKTASKSKVLDDSDSDVAPKKSLSKKAVATAKTPRGKKAIDDENKLIKKTPASRGNKQKADIEDDIDALGSTSDGESTETGFDESDEEFASKPSKRALPPTTPSSRPPRSISRTKVIIDSENDDGSNSDSGSGSGSDGDSSDNGSGDDDTPVVKNQPIKKARSVIYSDDESEVELISKPKVAPKTTKPTTTPRAKKSPPPSQIDVHDDFIARSDTIPSAPTGLAAKLLAKNVDSKSSTKNILSMFNSVSSKPAESVAAKSTMTISSSSTLSRKLALDSDSDDGGSSSQVVAKSSKQIKAFQSRFSVDSDSDDDFNFGSKSAITAAPASLAPKSSILAKSTSINLKSKFSMDNSDSEY